MENILEENKNIVDVKNENDSIKQENVEQTKEFKRIKSIDRFRGFCVFSMLIFQFLKNFPSLGILSRLANHSTAPGQGIVILPGMTLADIIAPMFIFAIGLTFALSFNKWKELKGTKYAIFHYLERALSIIGLGAFLAVVNKILDSFGGYKLNGFDWSVFAISIIALIALILRIVGTHPKLRGKFSFIVSQIFYVSLSILGLMDLVITTVDYVSIVNGNGVLFDYWVTLQDIGFAILLALPVVNAKSWVKLLVATLIAVPFSVYHQIGNNKELLDVLVHGGVVGGFGWGAMLMFDMFLADIFFKDKVKFFFLSSMFCALGVFLTQWLGVINMGSCSPTFILVAVGLSGVIFALFDLCDKYHTSKFDPLVWWGKNPIVMFLVEFFILGGYGELMPDSVLINAPVWAALIQGVLAIVLLTLFAYFLSRRKKSISL